MVEAGTTIELIQALVSNAAGLLDDARLLFDAGRYDRAFALATMAAEEHGKFEFCLDQLLGDAPRTEAQFRQAWTAHIEKLENLVAFRSAFVDELPLAEREALASEPARLHRERMSAIYVDLDRKSVRAPSTSRIRAEEMISSVRASLDWVEPLFRQLKLDMIPLLRLVAPVVANALDVPGQDVGSGEPG